MKLVSACLVGINCRYDAKNSANEKAVALVKEGKAIPVCPELLAGLSVPRPRTEIKNDMVFTKDEKDVTDAFLKAAEKTLALAKKHCVTEVIFKARSPSCGKGKVYDGSFSGKLVEGNGITAELLLKNGIKVVTEEEI